MLLFIIEYSTAFSLNGTIYDTNGTYLNQTNISVISKNSSWAQVANPSTLSNTTGWFNLTLSDNITFMHQISLFRYNTTLGAVDFVGQAVPLFPMAILQSVSPVNYYLKEAGTINITVINSTGSIIDFAYQIKDKQL
jgi:hypothetical protein